MDIPVPINEETDPINILMLPFEHVPPQKTSDGEDVFWTMVNGELDTVYQGYEESQRRKAEERRKQEDLMAQKALMAGGNDGEVVYESLVRPKKAVSRGEFPLIKFSTSVLSDRKPQPVVDNKPIPKVAHVPPKPPPKEVPKPPAQIEHRLDEVTSGLLKNSGLHIHRSRHDPTNLYWSMKKESEE